MPLTFAGNQPFHTELAQEPSADAEGETVILTLPVYVDDNWPLGAEMRFHLTLDEAQKILSEIQLAIARAQIKGKSR